MLLTAQAAGHAGRSALRGSQHPGASSSHPALVHSAARTNLRCSSAAHGLRKPGAAPVVVQCAAAAGRSPASLPPSRLALAAGSACPRRSAHEPLAVPARRSVVAYVKSTPAKPLPPAPAGGWPTGLPVFVEHRDDGTTIIGELDVLKYAKYWAGGPGSMKSVACVFNVKKVNRAGAVVERKEGSHSLTAVEAFAGREASRQPRFCIRLARGVGSLRAGTDLDTYFNSLGLEKNKREKGTQQWKQQQVAGTSGGAATTGKPAAPATATAQGAPKRKAFSKNAWPIALPIQTKPVPEPMRKLGKKEYEVKKDVVYKGKMNVNRCIIYRDKDDPPTVPPLRYKGFASISSVTRVNTKTGEEEKLELTESKSPTMFHALAGHPNRNVLVLDELLVQPPWSKDGTLIPLSQYLAEYGVALPHAHSLPKEKGGNGDGDIGVEAGVEDVE